MKKAYNLIEIVKNWGIDEFNQYIPQWPIKRETPFFLVNTNGRYIQLAGYQLSLDYSVFKEYGPYRGWLELAVEEAKKHVGKDRLSEKELRAVYNKLPELALIPRELIQRYGKGVENFFSPPQSCELQPALSRIADSWGREIFNPPPSKRLFCDLLDQKALDMIVDYYKILNNQYDLAIPSIVGRLPTILLHVYDKPLLLILDVIYELEHKLGIGHQENYNLYDILNSPVIDFILGWPDRSAKRLKPAIMYPGVSFDHFFKYRSEDSLKTLDYRGKDKITKILKGSRGFKSIGSSLSLTQHGLFFGIVILFSNFNWRPNINSSPPKGMNNYLYCGIKNKSDIYECLEVPRVKYRSGKYGYDWNERKEIDDALESLCTERFDMILTSVGKSEGSKTKKVSVDNIYRKQPLIDIIVICKKDKRLSHYKYINFDSEKHKDREIIGYYIGINKAIVNEVERYFKYISKNIYRMLKDYKKRSGEKAKSFEFLFLLWLADHDRENVSEKRRDIAQKIGLSSLVSRRNVAAIRKRCVEAYNTARAIGCLKGFTVNPSNDLDAEDRFTISDHMYPSIAKFREKRLIAQEADAASKQRPERPFQAKKP
jgi:hypothetical protein